MPDRQPADAPDAPCYGDSSLKLAARFAVLREPTGPYPIARMDDGPRYEFGETFAQGGLGRIRRAFDRRLRRTVAVKEIHDRRRSGSTESRFMREALITARLEHPSIIPIHDVSAHADGAPYYCMKLVDGRSLESIVQVTTTLAERLALVPHVLAVADALAYAHDKEVIHRDLKPSNVLVGPFGETVIIDWGLAKDLREPDAEVPDPGCRRTLQDDFDHRSLTLTGELLGTLPYMPLEQATGGVVGPSADVYAIGALLYHVLGGRPPYDDEDKALLYQRILASPPPDILTVAPNVPADLAAIVRHAMARNAEDRYASARELAADLRRFQSGRMVSARTYSSIDILRYLASRYRTQLSMASLSLILLGTLSVFSYIRIARENGEAERHRTEAEESRVIAERNSAEARREAQRAKDTAFTALLAAGRGMLFDQHRPEKALPVLNEAYWLAPSDRRVRMLLGEAMVSVDALQRVHLLPDAATHIRFDPETHRLLAVDGKGSLHIWRAYGGWSEPVPVEPGVTVLTAEFVPKSADGLLIRSSADELIYYEGGIRRWRAAMPTGALWEFHNLEGLPDVFVVGEHGIHQINRTTGATTGRWPLPSGVEEVELMAHSSRVGGFHFLGHGRSADRHGVFEAVTILRLDVDRASLSTVMRGYRHNKHSPVVSHNGRWVSLIGEHPGGNEDGEHHIFDLDHPGSPRRLDQCESIEGNRPWLPDAVFTLDDHRIVRMLSGHALVAWNVASGTCERKAVLVGDKFDSIQMSSDGHSIVAIGRNDTVAVLDTETLRLRRQFSPGTARITDVVISPGSQRVAIAGADGHVGVWSIGKLPRRLREGDQLIASMPPIISASGASDGRISLLRWSPGEETRELPHSGEQAAPRRAPARSGEAFATDIDDGPVIATPDFVVAFDLTNRVSIWPRDTGPRRCAGMGLDGDFSGHVLAFSAGDRLVLVAPSGNPPAVVRRPVRITTVDVSACRSSAVDVEDLDVIRVSPVLARGFTTVLDGPASILDTTTGATLATIPIEDGHTMFTTLAPNGRDVVTSTGHGQIRVYDIQTGDLRAELKPHESVSNPWVIVRHAAFFSPDHQTFVTASPSGSIDVWDAASFAHLGVLSGHVRTIDEVAFSTDSTRAVSFSGDNFGDSAVFLWDLDRHTGTRLPVEDVTEAAFTPDGDVLATGTGDGVVLLWDAASGDMVGRYEGHTSYVRALMFAADGTNLTIGYGAGTIHKWKLPLETRTPAQIDALLASRESGPEVSPP